MSAPDDWIGQEVLVRVSFSDGTPYTGTLEALDEHGIVLRHEMEDMARTTRGLRSVLYPCSVVDWMYPTEEQPPGQSGSRPRPRGRPAEMPEDPAP
jgi:hypothetical protein